MNPNYQGRTFDVALALVLLFLSGPLFLGIALLILWDDGRPIFYAGKRLGQDKEPFTMYKFRTLVPNANALRGADMVEDGDSMVTRVGEFLRPARLDELPQLINVLKGDMQIVGPRPVRPELYEKTCREIPNYDERFTVPPGLLGFSQLFTPHDTPKIFRTVIDNKAIRDYRTWWEKTYLLFRTVWGVASKMLTMGLRWFHGPARERREDSAGEHHVPHGRAVPRGAKAYLNEPYLSDNYEQVGKILDMDSEAFRLQTKCPLETSFPCHIKITVQHSPNFFGPRQKKAAFVKCEPLRQMPLRDDRHDYVMRYEPISPLSRYLIQQYFLKESLAIPE